METRFLRLLAGISMSTLLALVVTFTSGGGPALSTCPLEKEEPSREEGRPRDDDCLPRKHPESLVELMSLNKDHNAHLVAPFAFAPPEAHAAAVGERVALGSSSTFIENSEGTWRPYGKTPLIANHADYRSINGLGFVHLSGRIDDLYYDPDGRRLFAALGSGGGVWLSTDKGQTWRSIGDELPTQVVASVGWTPANGGRVIALTGEPTYGHYSQIGLGAYYSDDTGGSWTRANGIPNGTFGFKIAVDPTNPNVVFAATGRGLYRSTDAGANFSDVVLPTGSCAGKFDLNRCLLANMVTDVVVQASDRFGNEGGAVMAAVGWRAGRAKNPDGGEQSTGNGIYISDSGAPGTFSLSIGGFAPQDRIGRTELGVANGASQNHDYVYSIVQDAVLLQGGVPVIDAPDVIKPGLNNTALNGVYVSADFGRSWTQMADDNQISGNPASGSALYPLNFVAFGPGVQAWYNLFILPDPTRQDQNGVPTRLVFGMEEVWQNEITTLPQNGKSTFKVIGRYYAGNSCSLLNTGQPVCPIARPPHGTTTTHPDQHDVVWIPEDDGGVSLGVGNDGGFFLQNVAKGVELDNGGWGAGRNNGFHTLLPYSAAMAKDGVVWFGLQDNGTGKAMPDGTQYMTLGGDGFFVAVDPDNSNIAYGEQTFGSMDVTKNGGKTWTGISPPIYNSRFSNPFVMDPANARHLMTAGTPVVETTHGPDTGASEDTNWAEVFNLGTRDNPGKPPEDTPEDYFSTGPHFNQMTSLDLNGVAAYVGYCSACDVLTSGGMTFRNGIATNVGGGKPPKPKTSDGWHISGAKGLPNRMITAVEIDPSDSKIVYVGLGGYSRRWTPPGSFGLETGEIGEGHLYRSTDAGQTFTNVSGDLPDTPVTAIQVYAGTQLAVGTDLGVFISSDLSGSMYKVLGTGLPIAPISTLQTAPQDPSVLVAATFGRGVYVYALGPTIVKHARLAATGWNSRTLHGLALLMIGLALARVLVRDKMS